MEVRHKRKVEICFRPPKNVRAELARPYGILFLNNGKLLSYLTRFERIITVGDVVTSLVTGAGITPFLSVVDGKTRRSVSISTQRSSVVVTNEAGILRFSAMSKIKEIMHGQGPTSVFIEGEDDMMVIPIILYGKSGDLVVYGQPNAGAVCLENWDGAKWRVMDIFSKFTAELC
ncbi:hypothetical protein L3N51_00195 [Metallosphaera sp. J1]|uniref:GTP-dependent dephospho-CoA kinase family protein n=1 Tax=Metallosphaera TaxID=41980 RepID=UPI001EDFC38C|nr:GTP-dependent dephospho-CoA kinase family protein [Metallosphaera javensis (ex Hofmann et al. 2022)]MCG3107921.1 hypothetical protein [Metallosphaera javensis (ex Hofmann et al. 2022)]BCS91923.1 MAG: hypothetical protein MjAS7_0531 [Metallosphaera javensis (ex Sakai et al. 2022)]